MASEASAGFYQSAFWRDLRTACFARDRGTCVVPGCAKRATHCDHIRRRYHSARPTSADVLTNLRSLCGHHDAQVKEMANGERRNGGAFKIRGSDASGWPLDPARR